MRELPSRLGEVLAVFEEACAEQSRRARSPRYGGLRSQSARPLEPALTNFFALPPLPPGSSRLPRSHALARTHSPPTFTPTTAPRRPSRHCACPAPPHSSAPVTDAPSTGASAADVASEEDALGADDYLKLCEEPIHAEKH